MLIIISLLSRATGPYWSMLRRRLAEERIAPLTIGHASNLLGHPIGITLLAVSGNFLLPNDPMFFLYWSILIAITTVGMIFAVLALVNTKFFTAQILGSLGFVTSSLWASLILHEPLTWSLLVSLLLGVVGVVLFAWKDKAQAIFKFDKGMIYTLLAVVLGGLAAVVYKLASLHVSGYAEMFTGRFVGDLIAWTAAWLISLWWIKRNPLLDLKNMLTKKHGQILAWGTVLTTSLDTYLIYNLSVTTLAVVSTIAFPVSYFISYFKYREKITAGMWLGTVCILISIGVYLLYL